MPANANFKKLGTRGEVLLLLHGWQHSIDNLWLLAKILSSCCQVYLLDLPGFGKTPYDPAMKATADYVQFIKRFITEQNIKPVLLGHSFGGRIAVKLAALYPELLADKLILMGVPGLHNKRSLKKRCYLYCIKYSGKLLKLIDFIFRTKLFKNKFATRFGSRDYQNAGALRDLFVQVINEDLSPFAAKIRKKTLLLWGKNDYEAPLSQAHGYQELINDSHLYILAYHGHEPFQDAGAYYLTKLIREFLDA